MQQGWSGSLTPSLVGYVFNPVSRNYINVTINESAQDHAAFPAFQLTGTATAGGSPLAGVAFTATNGGACTASDAAGQYSCTVIQGWSGSVTPAYAGYAFAPVSRDYSAVAANQTVQDYAALPAFTLSGTVAAGSTPTAGVTFTASNGGTCTASNASGQYSCNVPQGWTGSVTPALLGYGFTPASRAYNGLAGDQAAQDYAAANAGATTVYYIHPDHLNTPRLIAAPPATTSLNQLGEDGTRCLLATERGGPITHLCARSTRQFCA